MSQSDFGVIDPNTKSGTQLAVDLNGFRDAVNSGHSGATRPAYLPAGGHWVRIVSSTKWDLVFYDGSVDYTLRSVNPTTGQKIGIPAADLADKQTSTTDNTAGRLLTVGAFGLGGASTYLTNLDLLTTQTGYYHVDGSTTGTHPAVATFATVEVGRYSNSNSVYQVYRVVGNVSLAGRVFNRLYNSTSLTWLPWIEVATSANNFGVNGVRIDVASASTVNLTTAAPNTLHINITGTTTITGFTVAAGQCYFVRFAGALTLTNNANIVTQSGANITTAAGDTCIIRATAANVVEVLAYTPFKNQAVGHEQTWQDVTGSRAIGTTYTNSTGKAIFLAVSAVGGANTHIGITVNGVQTIYGGYNSASLSAPSTSLIIPAGSTYSVQAATALNKWFELR